MNAWDELANITIPNTERYQNLFAATVRGVKNNTIALHAREETHEEYILVVEDNRMQGYYIIIVPTEAYSLFKRLQQQAPHAAALGFSVVAGQHAGKAIRVSCFGIPCNALGKALFSSSTLH